LATGVSGRLRHVTTSGNPLETVGGGSWGWARPAVHLYLPARPQAVRYGDACRL